MRARASLREEKKIGKEKAFYYRFSGRGKKKEKGLNYRRRKAEITQKDYDAMAQVDGEGKGAELLLGLGEGGRGGGLAYTGGKSGECVSMQRGMEVRKKGKKTTQGKKGGNAPSRLTGVIERGGKITFEVVRERKERRFIILRPTTKTRPPREVGLSHEKEKREMVITFSRGRKKGNRWDLPGVD